MTGAEPIEVLILAGRLLSSEAAWASALAERLGERGASARLLAISVEPPIRSKAPWNLDLGLGSRWRRPWTCRRLAGPRGLAVPSLIHAVGAEAAEPARRLSKSWDVPYVLSIGEFLAPRARLRLGPRCRGVAAGSREIANDLAASFAVPRPLLRVVRPGVEPAPTFEAIADDSLPERTVRVLGTAGPLVSGAGGTTLLAAARRLAKSGREIEVVFAGGGPAEPALREAAARHGLSSRVTFIGDPVVQTTCWEAIDVFCYPNIAPTAGAPLLEALARGLPCVASDAPGLADHFEPEGSGLRHPSGDPDALAAAIGALLDDPNRASAIGRAGRERIALLFDPGREADEFGELYRIALAPDEDRSPRAPRTVRADAGPPSANLG